MTDATSFVSTPEGIGRIEGEKVALLDLRYPDLGALLVTEGSLGVALRASIRALRPLEATIMIAPIPAPGKIWGVGLNYRSKARETGRPIPEEPIVFMKASSAVTGSGSTVRLPAIAPAQVDYEGEVAVVVARRTCAVSEADAWSRVAGITGANDLGARDIQSKTHNPTIAKSFDGFAPLGASLVPLECYANPDNIGIETRVNGEICQQATTSDLIFSVPRLVSTLSHYATLEPGDIILTGTPPGTGTDRGFFLTAGDEVSISVEGAVPLSITIAGPTTESIAVQ